MGKKTDLALNRPAAEETQVHSEAEPLKRLAISDVEPAAEGFWQETSIDQLAEEQGVRPVEQLEDVLGRHAALWESDEEFERFVDGIYERRRA